jgi:hypothetical protein
MDRLEQRLKIGEVADVLNVTPGLARNLLREWGVEPCADYGPGRGRGFRWSRVEIEAAVAGSVPARKVVPGRVVKKRRKHALDGDRADVLAGLFG